MENIEAVNNEALGALELETGKVAVSMYMNKFQFEKSLMQEHFNENYIESDKYPKATFSGMLEGFDVQDLNGIADSVSYDVNGQLTIHGVTNPMETAVWISRKSDTARVWTTFIVDVASFDIDIPKIVVMNIVEKVEVTAIFTFEIPE